MGENNEEGCILFKGRNKNRRKGKRSVIKGEKRKFRRYFRRISRKENGNENRENNNRKKRKRYYLEKDGKRGIWDERSREEKLEINGYKDLIKFREDYVRGKRERWGGSERDDEGNEEIWRI